MSTLPVSIADDKQPMNGRRLRRLPPTLATVIALEDVTLAVGERHVRGPGGIHVDRVHVRLKARRDAAGEAGPGPPAVLRAKNAAFGSHSGTVEAARAGSGGSGKQLLRPLGIHGEGTAVALALEA